MHTEAIQYVLDAVDDLCLNPSNVLDLGGRNINGTARDAFPNVDRYVAVDIAAGPCVDIVCDAADLDIDERFDVVVSTELLEHTARAAEIVATACRHLRPGGVFIATMAGPGRPPHGASGESKPPRGEHYRNVEPDELHEWLRAAGFTSWDVNVHFRDVRCTAVR